MMISYSHMVIATLTLGWATSSVSAGVGDKTKSGTRGGGGTDAITMLSSTEIDAFQEIVRNHHDRPLNSIPVSEGGTTFGSVAVSDVLCGGHRAATCSECPQGNGAGWCNGDCTWNSDSSQCENPHHEHDHAHDNHDNHDHDSVEVICGGHSAPTCSECPQGHGASWCNGECTWNFVSSQCEPPPQKRCDDDGMITRPTCSDCTATECTGTLDCELMPTTDLCRYVLDDKSRSASVHLNYILPEAVPKPTWWFQRLDILSSTDATYFSTSGHRFGYAGFQESHEMPYQGRILFSIWDQGGCDRDKDLNCPETEVAKTIACGSNVKCEDFGGEGTGRKSIVYSNDLPVINTPYQMVTRAKLVGPYRMQYSAYFYLPGQDAWESSEYERGPFINTRPGWHFLSTIEVGTDAEEQWHMSNMYSFLEQWTGVSGLERRAAVFGPSFVAQDDGEQATLSFQQISQAHFSFGKTENHKHVNAFSTTHTGIGLEIGGDVVREAREHQVFTFPETNMPQELVDFANHSGCLTNAVTVVEIESCLVNIDDNVETAVY